MPILGGTGERALTPVQAKIKRRPLGSGIGSPNSFAVSIQSRIASCALESRFLRGTVCGASRKFRHLSHESLVFLAPVNNNFVFIHSISQVYISRGQPAPA